MSWIDLAHSRRLAALAGLALLSACAAPHAPDPTLVAQPKLPLEQFRPVVETQPAELALVVHPAGALSERQKAALADFLQRWRDQGGGTIALRTPAGVENADLAAINIAAVLTEQGAPLTSIRREPLLGPAPAGGPVVALAFEAAVAKGPDCTGHWDDVTRTLDNRPYAHFGCADAANLAAMVADPRDLTRPHAEDPSDAPRRQDVLTKYRKGDLTSSKKDEQATGAISQAVK